LKLQLPNILRPDKVGSITVHFKNQQDYAISFCIISRKKNQLIIESKLSELRQIDELKAHIPKNIPLIINFSGKVVLNKEYGTVGEDSHAGNYIQNNTIEDFYQFEYVNEGSVGISICRKSIVDGLLHEFGKNFLNITGTSIGPYSAVMLWNKQLIEANTINLPDGELSISRESSLFHFSALAKEKKSESVTISDEIIEQSLVLPYVNGIAWLLGFYPGNYPGQVPSGTIEGFVYKYIIDKTKYIVLTTALIVLIVNFLAYDSYRKKEAQIGEELQLNAKIIAQRDSLEIILAAKESFIKYIGENKTYYSYMLDEFASTVPEGIVLNRLDFNPLLNKIQKNESVSPQKKIVVTGSSTNSLVLNQWLNQLAGINWIKKTNVISFKQNDENKQGIFIFEINYMK